MAKRDQIIEPFVGFEEIPFSHKVHKGFVKMYKTDLDVGRAGAFLVQHGYSVDGAKDKAVRYTRAYGKYWVGVIYNGTDRSMLVAAERERR